MNLAEGNMINTLRSFVIRLRNCGVKRCLRCEHTVLGSDGYPFYHCPQCLRQYRVCDNGRLVSRWLEPITLVLYPLIFAQEPVTRVRDASEFARRQSVAWRRALVREIRLELETPTQAVRDILDCRGSEEDLREFLRLLADEIGRGLPPNARNDGERRGGV